MPDYTALLLKVVNSPLSVEILATALQSLQEEFDIPDENIVNALEEGFSDWDK